MLNEIEKERFNNKVCAKEVRISADIFVSSLMTESAAEVDIVVPDSERGVLLDLYVRICKFALIHGEDLQELFETSKYVYMSCVIHDITAFKTEFENEEFLKHLFNHGKGEAAMFLISFPEKNVQS